MKSKWKVF